MSVQITDCTIRDGGYLLNLNSDKDFVKGVISGLTKAGIDFVETGFLRDSYNGESIVYKTPKDIIKYLPNNSGNTQFLGFCDNSRYSIENLEDYDGHSVKWIRIAFLKHEVLSALKFCAQVRNKGYIVQFNAMDTISYSENELKNLIYEVNKIEPASFSISDTFGVMHLDDLNSIFNQIDSVLDKNIKLGLHSHDNLGLSAALAEQFIMLAREKNRNIIVDGSLLGMARGAGNAPTELIVNLLNKKYGCNYNISALIETVEKYIIPLKQQINWGYDLSMFICGACHSHVDNINYLKNNTDCSVSDMYKIINNMPEALRIRYNKNYSKSDFTGLKTFYDSFFDK